jgi:hypothetical protein
MMTPEDSTMLAIARQLADALLVFSKSREQGDLKQIGLLNTELCAARRKELRAAIDPPDFDEVP